MMRGGAPIIVLSHGTKRESGHQVQLGNIAAAKVRLISSLNFFCLITWHFDRVL